MTNVITTLGTATGGGNAISDLSFSGNTLIPAKNINFITADFDQNISGSKTITSTIHFVGIQVQNYDNLCIVLADGDVALLLFKTDKSELIDAYNKTEVDTLLDDKLNVSYQIDAYTKTQDDALLLLKADKTQLIDSYTRGETNNLLNSKADSGASYAKDEDDALLLLKADKTQLIDARTKREADNLLNDKANSGVSYKKGEDDALLLLKADKIQLIHAYTKGEADNLLNNKTDYGVLYTKQEDDALLLLKANQSTTYIKTEIDQLRSQTEVGNVDLSGCTTLSTSQTITANKTFNDACRFVSSIDGMATITGSQFVKSGADDTVVLLEAGGTKPISEFAGTSTDLSNYFTKTQTYSKTETNNEYVRLGGSIQQTITGRLKYVNTFGETYNETWDQVAKTYLTQTEVDAKLTNYVNTVNNQEINGTKTFNANINATGFVKIGKDDTSVLLADSGNRLLSSFDGIEDLSSFAFSGMNGAVIQYKLIRIRNLYIFSLLAYGGNYNAGTFNPDYLVSDDTAIVTYILFPNRTNDKEGYVMVTYSTGLITLNSTINTNIQCASATWIK
ncbi:MAG: hypothetical protein EZS28_011536 [Streblomastix strix]|uniref:Uncharacterized protein n=1 Tax=Streblomastix strix TaxID=222440 RepID=A0A5J4WDD3_9EUKA|nr:MAG: hypothetical protein EZS28_011536 [Streblomastix strix]